MLICFLESRTLECRAKCKPWALKYIFGCRTSRIPAQNLSLDRVSFTHNHTHARVRAGAHIGQTHCLHPKGDGSIPCFKKHAETKSIFSFWRNINGIHCSSFNRECLQALALLVNLCSVGDTCYTCLRSSFVGWIGTDRILFYCTKFRHCADKLLKFWRWLSQSKRNQSQSQHLIY